MHFNPRTHEGCDKTVDEAIRNAYKISIHAPTRGATNVPFRKRTSTIHFNPRTHEGCDQEIRDKFRCQSDFNPRTHEGCDAAGVTKEASEEEFQSTHPRGVRPEKPDCILADDVEFQSTHPRTQWRGVILIQYF